MPFDVQGARSAGYSDAEIAAFLGPQMGFDVEGATKAGYQAAEIVGILAERGATPNSRGPVAVDDNPLERPLTPQASTPGTTEPTFTATDPTPKSVLDREPARPGQFDFKKAAAANLAVERAGAPSATATTGKPITATEGNVVSRGVDLFGASFRQATAGAASVLSDAANLIGADKAATALRTSAAGNREAANRTQMGEQMAVALVEADPFASGLTKFGAKYAPQIAAQLPQIGVAMVTGGIAFPATLQALGSYDEARQKGLDPVNATFYAVGQGTAEAMGEKFGGMGKVAAAFEQAVQQGFGRNALSTLGQRMASAGLKEVPSELATYTAQFGLDRGFGVKATTENIVGEFIEGAKDTAIVAAGAGGLMGGAGAMASRGAPAPIRTAADLVADKWGEPFAQPVLKIGAATNIDEAIAAANQAIAVPAPAAPASAAPSARAVDNIARILETTEPANVSASPAVPGVVEPTGASGMPVAGVGVESGVGTDVPAGPAVGAGNAGTQPAGEPVSPDAGGVASPRSADAVDQRLVPVSRRVQAAVTPQSEPAKTWFGRRGDGYQTIGDATMALPSRQRIAPELNWQVEPMPSGKFRLAGYASTAVKSVDAIASNQTVQAEPDAAGVAISGAPSQDGGASGVFRDTEPGLSAAGLEQPRSAVAAPKEIADGQQARPVRTARLDQGGLEAREGDSQRALDAGDTEAASIPGDQVASRAATQVTRTPPTSGVSAFDEYTAETRLGRDGESLSEGGKPFRRQVEAKKAQKLQPMMRVVKVDGGFALRLKTAKELAAQASASKRLGRPNTSAAGAPIPAHAFIAAEGGLSQDEMADSGFDKNVKVGNRSLFAAKRSGLTIEKATEKLIQAGYLKDGDGHNQAYELIRRSVSQPQYTPEGWERIAAAEQETRYEDHLAARQDEEFDPFPPALDEYTDAELEAYAQADDQVKAEVQALLALAEARGIDTESIRGDAARLTSQGSEQDYYEATRTALQAAVQGSDGNRNQAAGDESEAGSQAATAEELATAQADLAQLKRDRVLTRASARADIDARIARLEAAIAEREGLTAPTREGILTQQQRAKDGEAAEAKRKKDEQDKAAADAERDGFTLTGSDRSADIAEAKGQKGMFALADPTDSAKFKAWFGDSKVVDEKGKPLVVYHGTGADITAFKSNDLGLIFTSPDPAFASKFAYNRDANEPTQELGANVMPVYVSAQRPFDPTSAADRKVLIDRLLSIHPTYTMGDGELALMLEGRKTLYTEAVLENTLANPESNWVFLEQQSILDTIERAGFDSVYVTEDGKKNLALFAPEQIKSATGNNGDFDPKNPDIRFAIDAARLRAHVGISEAPMPMTEVQALVKRLTAKWQNPPKIHVVGNHLELPVKAPKTARGFYNGEVWLVQRMHRSADDVARTLAHEAVAHHGLESILGAEQWARFIKTMNLAIASGNKPLKAAAEYVDRAYGDLDPKSRTHEIAARVIEGAVDPKTGEFNPGYSWLKSVWAQVADWLRAMLGKYGDKIQFTRSELHGMLVLAQKNLEAGKRLQGGGEMVLAAEGENDQGLFAVSDNDIEASNTGADEETRAPELSPWRDATGRMQFAPGAWLFDKLGDAAGPMLAKVGLKAANGTLRRQLRQMKLTVQAAQEKAAAVATETVKLSAEEREMVSDIIEKELKAGTVPPDHAVRLAALINDSMNAQTDELVRLGMLTKDSADLWRGKYLPRFYKSKLGKQVGDAWADAVSRMTGRPRAMAGIKGKHLRGRGLYETIPVDQLESWKELGWEVRDPDYSPTATDVQVWRDFTREERDKMGEIRDAGFRFVLGYMQTQRDIALGRMFEGLANDSSVAGKRETKDFTVQVPDGTVPGTGAKRYGMLAGKWVAKETMSHLSQIEESQSEAWRMYRKAMGLWKEGKTALNPVSHVNNMLSNMTMAHFAGVGYHRADKYFAAAKDFATKAPGIKAAKDAGLFLGTMSDAELYATLPDDLKALVQQQDSTASKIGRTGFNIMTFYLRRPMGWAYQAEDTFFRYLLYKDATDRGMEPQDAVDWAQKFIFTYDDLPKGARMIRDFGIPFFSYTYKAVPALIETAMTHPVRLAVPAGILWGINAAAYAIAADDDDDSWDEMLKKYLTDPTFREKARSKEKLEREHLPPWMKGTTALLTPKTLRLGTDELTKLPLFIDISRIIPGGDLFDVSPNAGGIPLPQPLTPSHPLFTTLVALLANKDLFRGKDLVDTNDTKGEAAEKRAAWLWTQLTPAIAAGNYHWDRSMNALAQASGGEIKWMPEWLAEDYTGIGKDGLPVQTKHAIAQTFGIKIRPIDLDTAESIDKNLKAKMIADIDAEIRKLKRLNSKGAVSDRVFENARELAREKKSRLKDGLTVDGDEKP